MLDDLEAAAIEYSDARSRYITLRLVVKRDSRAAYDLAKRALYLAERALDQRLSGKDDTASPTTEALRVAANSATDALHKAIDTYDAVRSFLRLNP